MHVWGGGGDSVVSERQGGTNCRTSQHEPTHRNKKQTGTREHNPPTPTAHTHTQLNARRALCRRRKSVDWDTHTRPQRPGLEATSGSDACENVSDTRLQGGPTHATPRDAPGSPYRVAMSLPRCARISEGCGGTKIRVCVGACVANAADSRLVVLILSG